MLLYRGPDADEFTDEHEGWVAGRFRDGSLSGIWTDVLSCAAQTFTAYLPRCECGWIGTAVPPTSGGHNSAQLQWRSRHLPQVVAQRPAPRPLPEPACVQGSFVPER